MIWNVFRITPENPIEKGEEVYQRSLKALRARRHWPPHLKFDKSDILEERNV